tara:strand:- start:230 stop:559 length:330 start_codon:yes stop_codon:yes gene_type:complete
MKVRVASGKVVLNKDEVIGVGTTAASPLVDNGNRASFVLQNVGTSKVYVRMGAAPVINGANKYYSFILPPASGDEEGDGGVVTVEDYQGKVYVVTASGSSTLIVTEFIR